MKSWFSYRDIDGMVKSRYCEREELEREPNCACILVELQRPAGFGESYSEDGEIVAVSHRVAKGDDLYWEIEALSASDQERLIRLAVVRLLQSEPNIVVSGFSGFSGFSGMDIVGDKML